MNKFGSIVRKVAPRANQASRSAPLRAAKHASRSVSSVSAARTKSAARTFSSASAAQKEPVRIAVTGSAGNIGYALLFRIASGAVFGPDQPVIIHAIELPHAMGALKGVAMELDDCAFPLLKGVVQSDNVDQGFDGIDYAMLVGSKPRGPGMERGDLLKDNGKIFTAQGKALNKFAKKTVKVVVVGNPANTNCLIAASNAPDIPAGNFTAMTRLDHNRALSQVAEKTGTHVTDIEKLCIWGNHSATQYPDLSHALIKGRPAKEVINDNEWVQKVFIPDVQQRGAAVIKARGASSAASAGNGAIDHVRDWVAGTNGGWTSMAIPSDGSYGVEKGVYYSYPVTCQNGEYSIVKDLPIDDFSANLMEKTKKELFEERDAVAAML